MPLLNADQIVRRARAAQQGLVIEVISALPSTNTELRARIARLSGPMLLAAELQTAGRGRLGRQWHSAPGDSLCFSLAWPFQGPLSRLSGLSLVIGAVVAETLRGRGWPVQLKWPNDLLLEGAKLGGILIDTAPSPAAPGLWAVIGIGLNVRANQARDQALGHAAASLQCESADHPTAIDRNDLLATLTDALCDALEVFDLDGLSPFIDRWHMLHQYHNQAVCLSEQNVILHEGIARGIDGAGRLLLDTAAGRIAVAAGDVSLRPADQPLSLGGAHAAG